MLGVVVVRRRVAVLCAYIHDHVLYKSGSAPNMEADLIFFTCTVPHFLVHASLPTAAKLFVCYHPATRHPSIYPICRHFRTAPCSNLTSHTLSPIAVQTKSLYAARNFTPLYSVFHLTLPWESKSIYTRFNAQKLLEHDARNVLL